MLYSSFFIYQKLWHTIIFTYPARYHIMHTCNIVGRYYLLKRACKDWAGCEASSGGSAVRDDIVSTTGVLKVKHFVFIPVWGEKKRIYISHLHLVCKHVEGRNKRFLLRNFLPPPARYYKTHFLCFTIFIISWIYDDVRVCIICMRKSVSRWQQTK